MLFQPALSILLTLLAFALMIWPGYAVLHLLGLGHRNWKESSFAGPAVTLALWIVALSGAVWASIPLKNVCGPVGIASLALAVLGIALRISARRSFSDELSDNKKPLVFWFIAAALPIAIVPSTLHYGLGIFASSICQDAWNYIAAADYFSHHARGVEGGLSPLDQYGALLMNGRNASSVLLAYIANGLGVSTAEVISLYCLLVLFANSAALVAFASSVFAESEKVISLVLFAGFAVPLLIVTYANFDQMLLLALLPPIAALATRIARGENIPGSGLAIGLLSAAAFYAYVEMAVLGLPVALTFAIAPEKKWRRTILRLIKTMCFLIPAATVLLWPGAESLFQFFISQFSTASQAGLRPGDGALANWLLAGGFIHLRWFPALLAAAMMIATTTAGGVWFERKRWAAVLAFVGVTGIICYFMFYEKYPYAVYKVASINFWMIGFFTISGAAGILSRWRIGSSAADRFAFPVALACALALIVAASTVVETKVRANAVHQEAYREAVTLASMIGTAPTILSVRDEAANQWAVFYLASASLIIGPYRSTMNEPEVRPFMARARAVDSADVQFVITDHDETIRSSVSGAHLIWDGQAYSLWRVDNGGWTVAAEGGAYGDAVHLSGLASAASGIAPAIPSQK
jgi:hypothetical protein